MPPLERCVWWPWGSPEHYPWIHCCCQGCGQGHPGAEQKFTGTDFCVPDRSVSTVDLTCRLEEPAKYDDIENVVKQESGGSLKGILCYTEDQIVYCDFNSDSYSSTFDSWHFSQWQLYKAHFQEKYWLGNFLFEYPEKDDCTVNWRSTDNLKNKQPNKKVHEQHHHQ